MRVFLFSSHHDLAEVEVSCSEHNLFGSLPVSNVGKIRYAVQVDYRMHEWRSDEPFDYYVTLIENIS